MPFDQLIDKYDMSTEEIIRDIEDLKEDEKSSQESRSIQGRENVNLEV